MPDKNYDYANMWCGCEAIIFNTFKLDISALFYLYFSYPFFCYVKPFLDDVLVFILF